MGSLKEEISLSVYMPDAFREACPVCKEAWTIESKFFHGERKRIFCKNDCFHFASTQFTPVNQMETAWRKLWRSCVQTYGLSRAINGCTNDPASALPNKQELWKEAVG
jgi:hypothetical protein